MAALALVPPCQVLDWDQVVKYAFLLDFDLLRDACQDIRRKPWATPAAQLAIDQAFKLEHAKEEIMRLNIEVPHLATYIRDKDIYLRAKEVELELSNPALAHQVSVHWMERGHFNAHHLKVLQKIHHLTIQVLLNSVHTLLRILPCRAPFLSQATAGATPYLEDLEEDLEEEQAGDDEDVVVLSAFFSVLDIIFDV